MTNMLSERNQTPATGEEKIRSKMEGKGIKKYPLICFPLPFDTID